MRHLPLFVLLVGICSAGFYEDDPDVTTLSEPEQFVETILNSGSIWVVEFYAPWCGHCKAFAPEFKKAAENLKNLVRFAAVDCDAEKAKPLCGHFQIKGLPTVLLFKSDLEQVKENGKVGFTKKPITYEGARTAAPLANWALANLPDRVSKVTSKNINAMFSMTEKSEFSKLENFALFFSNKDKTSNVLKAIQLEFSLTPTSKQWMPIGQVQNTDTELVTKYEIKSFPSLIVVNKKGELQQRFTETEFNHDTIVPFLTQFAYKPSQEDFAGKGKKSSSPPPPPPPPKKNELHFVDSQEDYDKACSKFGLCLIAFLDPQDPEQDKYIGLLNEIVAKYKSLNTVWVNGPQHPQFATQFPVADGFPQAVILHRRKLKVRVMKNAWEIDLVSEWVDNTLAGKGRTMGIDADPKFDSSTPEKTEEKQEL